MTTAQLIGILLLSLAAAVSPIVFVQASAEALVSTAEWRRFMLGALVVPVLLAVAMLGLLGPGAQAHAEEATSSRVIDLALGGVLVVWALLRARSRSKGEAQPDHAAASDAPPAPAAHAFGAGVLAMATNVTTLPLLIIALHRVAIIDEPLPVRVVLSAAVIAVVLLPVWLAQLATSPMRPRVGVASGRVRQAMDRYGSMATIIIGLVCGIALIVRAIIG